jgi:asparagine synthase (glutamine-hydrolysing)
MQPLYLDDLVLICNGEIFNHKELEKAYSLEMNTGSDCEIILHLYNLFGRTEEALVRLLNVLRGEFAFVLYNMTAKTLIAARDPFGIRPLFISYENNDICVASELKALAFSKAARPFLPGFYMIKTSNIYTSAPYYLTLMRPAVSKNYVEKDVETQIKTVLEDAVKIRLMSDRPVGCFLSGGVDSSIIAALVSEHLPRLECFSIGLKNGSDIEAAKKVVEHFTKNGKPVKHHIVNFTVEEGIKIIKDVIWHLETYDITTIRASILQFLLSRYIAKNTNIKVLYSGEGADEIFNSYLYSRLAPSPEALEQDSIRLLNQLYLFDNLRVDRTTAAFGLEVRIPFLDPRLVDVMMSADPQLRSCNNRIEKKILRDAFADTGLLPQEILYRQKHAFSDAVSSSEESWYKSLIAHIDKVVTDRDLVFYNDFVPPAVSKEAFYYRQIFNELFPERSNVLTHYWMPQWVDTNGDPSATVLPCF